MQGEAKCVTPRDPLRRAAVALGSNLGDREGHLLYAVTRLQALLADLSVSTFLETEPQDVGPQAAFLNAAVVGRSQAQPGDLLQDLLTIERERGRKRPFPRAPRTLDLDLILVGDLVVSVPGIQIPHPRFRERQFMLRPLAEIAADMVDPVTGLTVGALLTRVAKGGWRG